MITDHQKVKEIESRIEQFKFTFNDRPLMLGSPHEVNSMFFFVDMIDAIVSGHVVDNYYEFSWMAFLIEKKMIVGGCDSLSEKLIQNDHDFSELQALREDFYLWRKSVAGF
jgi:hypothetical protein